jgi:DNA-binding MarR family transcriptional regulator
MPSIRRPLISGRTPPSRGDAVQDRDYEVLAEFRYALRRFLHFSEQVAAAAGLSPQQHQALLALKGARVPPTIGYLAERLQVRHHSAVGLVDRLGALRLVERRTAEGDRRQVVVGLTAQGERVLRGLAAEHRRELREMEPQLEALLALLQAGRVRKGARASGRRG